MRNLRGPSHARVFVLALDGLTYDLVVGMGLKHLLQKQYGKIETIVNERLGVPTSPQVWGSFITGRVQQLDSWHVYNRPLEWIRRKSPLKWIKNKRKLSFRLGIKPEIVGRKHLVGGTLFDIFPGSIAIDVPTYSSRASDLIHLMETRLRIGLDAWEKECYALHEKSVEEIFKRIDENWDLFMVWIPIVDQLGHLGRKAKMRNMYRKLNLLAHNVRNTLPENGLLIIVSDHGVKFLPDGTGTHTNLAFYSFNKQISAEPKRITDFYKIIVEQLSSELTNGRAEVDASE